MDLKTIFTLQLHLIILIKQINALDKGCSLEVVVDPFFKSYFTEKVAIDSR